MRGGLRRGAPRAAVVVDREEFVLLDEPPWRVPHFREEEDVELRRREGGDMRILVSFAAFLD